MSAVACSAQGHRPTRWPGEAWTEQYTPSTRGSPVASAVVTQVCGPQGPQEYSPALIAERTARIALFPPSVDPPKAASGRWLPCNRRAGSDGRPQLPGPCTARGAILRRWSLFMRWRGPSVYVLTS